MHSLRRKQIAFWGLGAGVPGLLMSSGRVDAQTLAQSPPVVAGGRTIRVGHSPGALRSIGAAAASARDGDTVQIEAGDYRGDVAVWPQERLSIHAVGGPVRLFADGQAAQDKAIWVVRQGEFVISGIDFFGCKVPDKNGAGIRFESGHLVLRGCRFIANQSGLLSGNEPRSRLDIEQSLFALNGAGDGASHNLYVGLIASLSVRGSRFIDAQIGHLLKTRARVNVVLDCSLTDGPDGRSSYELEFPNGGDCLVRNCRIIQGAATENRVMVSYGVEGYVHPVNRLRMQENSFENQATRGTFIRVAPGPVSVSLDNNRFQGPGRIQGVPGWA